MHNSAYILYKPKFNDSVSYFHLRFDVFCSILFLQRVIDMKTSKTCKTTFRHTDKNIMPIPCKIPTHFIELDTHHNTRMFHSDRVIHKPGIISKASPCYLILKTENPVRARVIRGRIRNGRKDIPFTGIIRNSGVNNTTYRIDFTGMSEKSRTLLLSHISKSVS